MSKREQGRTARVGGQATEFQHSLSRVTVLRIDGGALTNSE
jgi:hypothetical protein